MLINSLLLFFKNKIINLRRLYGIFLFFIILTTNAQGLCFFCFNSDIDNQGNELVTTTLGHEFHLHCIINLFYNMWQSDDQVVTPHHCNICKKQEISHKDDKELVTTPNGHKLHLHCIINLLDTNCTNYNQPLSCKELDFPETYSYEYSSDNETKYINDCSLEYSKLFMCILARNRYMIQNIFDNNKNINLLHLAASLGIEDLLQALLKTGANSNSCVDDGYTPLHRAVMSNSTGCIEILLKAGANPNASDKDGITPLHISAKFYDSENFNSLLEAGANVEIRDKNGMTPLHISARNTNTKALNFLLKAGANINVLDKNGMTPLHTATKHFQSSVILFLLKAGADINIVASNIIGTALHIAVRQHDIKSVKALLTAEGKVDVNSVDEMGMSPIHIAAKHGNVDALTILLKTQGDSLDLATNTGLTPLHYAINNRNLHSFVTLLNAGSNINTYDKNGNTPLLICTSKSDGSFIRVLLDFKANVNVVARNPKGFTPLHFLAKRGYTECLKILLKAGPDIYACDGCDSPKNIAIKFDHKECAKILDQAEGMRRKFATFRPDQWRANINSTY